VCSSDLKGVPTLVDEAYIEFSDIISCGSLLDKYSNLFITRTFSKALGSAGIRAGVIIGSEEGIDRLMQFRPMYEINSLSIKWMNIVLDNYDKVEKYIHQVKQTRESIVQRCYNLGIQVVEGQSNWIHIQYSNLPNNILFKKNCSIPGSDKDWVRLQITDNESDYLWLK
jgi:histidinol-phosphate aminotransferase